MATLQLALLLSCAVLVSSLADQLLPKVSLPLLQIALGVGIALLAVAPIDITLDPNFFLVLFIAPLLFYESKEIDKLSLWKNRNVIISLALGLVLATLLAVGFVTNALVPSIPLAAAFAFGAAVSPTDAVAVSALDGTAKLRRTEHARLNGEALLNDASGVVAFQFAVAAAVTGSFSVMGAAASFGFQFFGGIVLGLVLGYLAVVLNRFTAEHDLGSNVFHVLFDVTLPFVVYLASVVVGVSGIIAVVATGLLVSMVNDRRVGPSQSSLNIVSDNVWKVLSFGLNGTVFVLLGMQLPKAMQDTWDDVAISNTELVGYIVILTFVIIVVRFLWLVLMDTIFKDPETNTKPQKDRTFWRHTAIATIGGPKGAITLSVILSTPFYTHAGGTFPQRDLLIFLASGVILLTLVLANIMLPILAPAPKDDKVDYEKEARAKVSILRNVIARLNSERTHDNVLATHNVVKSYNKRVSRIIDRADMESESSAQLRIDVLRHQQSYVMGLIDVNEVDPAAGYGYLRRLSRSIGYLQHHADNRLWFLYALRHGSATRRALVRYLGRFFERRLSGGSSASENEVAIKAECEAVNFLTRYVESPAAPYPAEVVAEVLLDYQRTLHALSSRRPSVTAYARATYVMEDVQRKAYSYELEEIHAALERGDIKRSTATHMRDNVYLMLVDLNAEIV